MARMTTSTTHWVAAANGKRYRVQLDWAAHYHAPSSLRVTFGGIAILDALPLTASLVTWPTRRRRRRRR